MFAGKKSAQIREILISESAWEEMTCLFAPSLEEFSEQAEPSEAHKILARLPIRTYWTTNYDTLIEDSLKENYRVADIKRRTDDLISTRPKRDAVVYKMHGDVSSPGDAILYKAQYEQYYKTHEGFVTALSGDLISKTFLFIGFSFTDPNLDYILSRLHVPEKHRRRHYCFLRKEPSLPQGNEDEAGAMYRQRRQEHHIRDLLRFGIQAVLVNEYDDIPLILKEIESRFLKKTIFISVKWFTEFGHLNRGDMLTSEQHRCHNEKKKFQRRV
nr:SIR2 family protein [Escherichia coli]